MQGYVLAFRPATGDGAIVAQSGHTYRFTLSAPSFDLCGGDIVSFEPSAESNAPSAADIKLLTKAAACIDSQTAVSLLSSIETTSDSY